MRKKKQKTPQLSSIELAKEELSTHEELLWGEQIHLSTTGAGCMAMFMGLLTLPGLIFFGGGFFNQFLDAFVVGGIWSSIGLFLTWKLLKSTRKLSVGLTKKTILFKKGRQQQIEVPLAQIREMEINGYFSGTKEGDLVLITRCKKLNTQDYKFRIENNRHNIEKVPNVMEVKSQIERAQQQLFLNNPDVVDQIEIEGED